MRYEVGNDCSRSLRGPKGDSRQPFRTSDATRQVLARQSQYELFEGILEIELIRLRRVVERKVADRETCNPVLLGDRTDAAMLNTDQKEIVRRLPYPAPRADDMLRIGHDPRKLHVFESVRFERTREVPFCRCIAIERHEG